MMLSFTSLMSASLAASVAAGQLVNPSNTTLDSMQGEADIQLSLIDSPSMGLSIYNIVPLTPNAGAGRDNNQLVVRPRR